MAQQVLKPGQGQIRRSGDAVRAEFSRMVTMIPEADDTDAAMDIVGQILEAGDATQVDKPWQESEQDNMTGRQIIVTSLTRRASDFKDGLGVYLRVEFVDPNTGEYGFFNTGSTNIVAQLVKWFTLDALPALVLVVEADKPSSNGYYPQHLELLDDQSKARELG